MNSVKLAILINSAEYFIEKHELEFNTSFPSYPSKCSSVKQTEGKEMFYCMIVKLEGFIPTSAFSLSCELKG
jgi:hypothetical protein